MLLSPANKKCLALFLLAAALSAPSWSTVGDLSRVTGARPLALGNAYAALSDDGPGMFINPAGLSKISRLKLTSLYNQTDSDTLLTSLGAALPNLAGGTIALGYRNHTIANIQVSAEAADFTRQEILLAYARQMKEDLSLAGTLRLFSQGFSKDLSGFESVYGNASAFDFSLKYNLRPWLDLGASLQNIGGRISYKTGLVLELPTNLILGSSFKIVGENAVCQNKDQEVFLNLDFSQEGSDPILLHLGIGYRPLEHLALRLGLDQTPKSPTENYNNLTGGLGFSYRGATFDYALYRAGDPSGAITHYFSLGYTGPKEVLPPLTPEVAVIKRPKLLHFSDVPKDHWARKQIEYLTTLGILNWYEDQTFRPERPITRAEMVMLLVRAKDLPLPGEKKQTFTDVLPSYWAFDYIQSAYERKLTYGYPDGTFKPRRSTTRAEAITFLARFDKLSLREILEKPFADLPLHHWSIREVLAAKNSNILEYLKDKPFMPSQGLTRAELAEFLFRTKFSKEKIKEAKFED